MTFSLTSHSFKSDERLGRRIKAICDAEGITKTEFFIQAAREKAESYEGDTAASIERKIEELEARKEEAREQVRDAEAVINQTESQIEELEARLDDMTAHGDYEELLDDLADAVEAGADLWVVNENTDKVDSLRQLGSFKSIEETIDAVEEHARTGGETDV